MGEKKIKEVKDLLKAKRDSYKAKRDSSLVDSVTAADEANEFCKRPSNMEIKKRRKQDRTKKWDDLKQNIAHMEQAVMVKLIFKLLQCQGGLSDSRLSFNTFEACAWKEGTTR